MQTQPCRQPKLHPFFRQLATHHHQRRNSQLKRLRPLGRISSRANSHPANCPRESVLCIENLTTFHQYIQTEHATRSTQHESNVARSVFRSSAIICTFGNPSPAVRRVLRLLPETTPIYLWSDLDYGGFNILSQLRRFVREQIRPHLMDVNTLEANSPRAHPITTSDRTNLKRLLLRPELCDVHSVIEHLLKRGLKLEQEGVETF